MVLVHIGAEGRVNLMVMKVYLKNLVAALESLESSGSSAAEKKEGLERLMPFVSGLGEACVEVGVDQIPTLKKAQAKQSEMDKQTEEAYSRARDLLLLFGTFSSSFSPSICLVIVVFVVVFPFTPMTTRLLLMNGLLSLIVVAVDDLEAWLKVLKPEQKDLRSVIEVLLDTAKIQLRMSVPCKNSLE